MSRRRHAGLASLVLVALVLGCAGPQGQATSQQAAASEQARLNRTLVVAHRYEPNTLAAKMLQSNGPLRTTRLFNATLALLDASGAAQPYLAESLPQLNTDTWRVFPDGRMETTYRLRPNLTWQDGTPLTADDFVFALRLYKDPNLGFFINSPQDKIDGVLAPDNQTVVVQWRTSNALGGSLTFGEFDPLPAHLIAGPFADYAEGRVSRDAFLANPLWTTEYVGAGPYRIEAWDPGSRIEGKAFDGHALGRAKIETIVVRIFIDENSTMATVLAGGQIDYACCNTLRFEHFVTLKRDWDAAGKGKAISVPSTAAFMFLQQRPEYVGDEALLDVRVRRALAHGIDRDALNDGLFDGVGSPTDTPVPPSVFFYPELQRIMPHYPLDPNRSAQLMAEAGFTKNANGFFANDQRQFHLDFTVQNSSEIERMQNILSDSWRKAGFEIRQVVMGTQLFTQQETRHTLPGLGYAFFTTGERSLIADEIGTPANRWSGNNRTGWTNPEYERLWTASLNTLDRNERGSDVARMMALVSEFLPGYALYFSQAVFTWVAGLDGPDSDRQAAGFGDSFRETTYYWNIQDWQFK